MICPQIKLFSRILLALLIFMPAFIQDALQAEELTALTHQPRGALATGNTWAYKVGAQYHFVYMHMGDEFIHYVIDMDHPNVMNGLIRIQETTLSNNAVPIAEGGLSWRIDEGPNDYETPMEHALQSDTELLEEDFLPQAKKLRLRYRDVRGDDTAEKVYEFWIVGKVLKIKAYGDTDVNNEFVNNYAGFMPGSSADTPDPVEQHLPHMDNAVVVRFADDLFYSTYNDWYKSNGCHVIIRGPTESNVSYEQTRGEASTGDGEGGTMVPAGTSYEHYYGATSTKNAEGNILAGVHEVLNLIVTGKLNDTFPVVTNFKSPYYNLTSGRMVLVGARCSPNAWRDYRDMYQKLEEWGVDSLTLHQFQTRKWLTDILSPDQNTASVMGCLPESIESYNTETYQDLSGKIYRWVDPDAQDNIDLANAEFISLAEAARTTGALFAHMVVHDLYDPWGHEPYPPGNATYDTYNIGKPLWKKGWSMQDLHFGLKLPAENPEFNEDWAIRDHNGNWKGAHDTNVELKNNTNWEEYGYRLNKVDYTYLYEHLKKRLSYGKNDTARGVRDRYQPNCVLFDVSCLIPIEQTIDESMDENKTHTIGDVMQKNTKTCHRLRNYIEGPLYGEATHWRWKQAYFHGARDGLRWKFPVSDENPVDQPRLCDSWIIPDYNFREVMPLSSGHAGLGWEKYHMAYPTPYDGREGSDGTYFDSYLTTTITYGNNPHGKTNGHHFATYYTYQGYLRMYTFLTDLARCMRESPVLAVEYGDASGEAQYSLAEALEIGLDLINPRIKITFENGLEFYANHDVDGGTNWPVTIPKIGSGSENVILEPNGFAAGDGTNIFVFFKATPDGFNTSFDYVNSHNRWRALNNRDEAVRSTGYTGLQYDNFPGTVINSLFTEEELAMISSGLIMKNKWKGHYIGASGGLWDTINKEWKDGLVVTGATGPAPLITSLEVKAETDTLYTLKPEGCVAIAHYANGAWRDVTTLADWTVLDGPAAVNISGAVTADALGEVTVRATWGAVSDTASFSAESGTPVAHAGNDKTALVEQTVVFNGTSSFDPKGHYLGYQWDFGDGTVSTNNGPIVSHVYTASGNYTVTLTVEDVEENDATDTLEVLITTN